MGEGFSTVLDRLESSWIWPAENSPGMIGWLCTIWLLQHLPAGPKAGDVSRAGAEVHCTLAVTSCCMVS